jgi:translation initiation factor IF-1
MVKNIKGGKGHKSIARKSLLLSASDTHVRLPENSLELFAVVTKFYGNMCDVTTHNNLELKCHIRGKFKGKSKRNAYIVVGKIILVGLRHYESTPKNCDLLHVFEANSYSTLTSLPSYNLNNIFNISSSISTVSFSCSSSSTIINEIIFSEDKNTSLTDLTEAQPKSNINFSEQSVEKLNDSSTVRFEELHDFSIDDI